jgi:ElaB/YqjD/DUF883 family membrane-anchored ribosome-binding protein
MADTKRTALKNKVEAGQARNRAKTENTTTMFDRAGERAIQAKDEFTAFAKEHPIATLAGGVAVGVLIAAMFKGPRRAAVKGGGKAAGLAAIGAELALAYAQQALETANEAGRAGAKRLDGLGDTARDVGRDAADRAGEAGGAALAVTRAAGRRLSKAIRHRIN